MACRAVLCCVVSCRALCSSCVVLICLVLCGTCCVVFRFVVLRGLCCAALCLGTILFVLVCFVLWFVFYIVVIMWCGTI